MQKVRVTLLAIALLFSFACKDKTKKGQAPPKTQYHNPCVIEKATGILNKLHEGKAHKRRPEWFGELLTCKKIPPVVQKVLRVVAPSSPNSKAQLLSGEYVIPDTPSYWDRVCPKLSPKNLKRGGVIPAQRRNSVFYKLCGGKATALLTEREAQDLYLVDFISLAVLYQWLLDAGVPAKTSRTIVRQGLLYRSTYEGIPLLPSHASRKFQHMTTVTLGPKSLLLNSRKICDIEEGKIAKSLYKSGVTKRPVILPLAEAAQREIIKYQKLRRYLRKESTTFNRVSLVVHPQTSYALLYDVIHTLKASKFKEFLLLAGKRSVPFIGSPRLVPIKLGEIIPRNKLASLPLLLLLEKSQSNVMLKGRSLQKDCQLGESVRIKKTRVLSNSKGSAASPAQALAQCLQKVKQRYPKTKELGVVGSSDLSYKRFHQSIDIARYNAQGQTRFADVFLHPPHQ